MNAQHKRASGLAPDQVGQQPIGTNHSLVDPALVQRVRARLVDNAAPTTPDAVLAALLEEGVVAGHQQMQQMATSIWALCCGLGPLHPLIADDQVSDIVVNGPNQVYVDRGQGLRRVPVNLGSQAEVRGLATRLASQAGRRLDPANPWVDASLPGGIRLHAVIAPVAEQDTLISLRFMRQSGFSLHQLCATSSVSPAMARLLRAAIAARVNVMLTGGTGCGKTTVLGALLGLVPAQQRIVIVEDTSELIVAHPHVVRLQTRPCNAEGAGQVDLRDLVRQALRMRPDRLVVGEVRGGDVVDLLAALNTGHEGGCATIHANSAADVPARIEALASMVGVGRAAVASQMASALQVIVGLRRKPDGLRVVSQLGVLTPTSEGLRVLTAWDEQGQGPGFSLLSALLTNPGEHSERAQGELCHEQ